MHILLLTTPDIRSTTLLEALAQDSDAIYLASGGSEPEKFISPAVQSAAALNQALLAAAQARWYQHTPYDIDAMSNYPVQHRAEALKSLLAAGRQWVYQDSLLCRFFPLWSTFLDSPQPVLYYSDPLECAMTLRDRWRFPLSFGLALWESYMLSAAAAVHTCSPLLVSGDHLRQDFANVVNQVRKITGQQQSINAHEVDVTLEPKPDTSAVSQFLRPAQKIIMEALDGGDIGMVARLSLSEESEDILQLYGQVRAGFEEIKSDRDRFRELVMQGESAEQPTSLSDHSHEPISMVTVHIEGREPLEFLVAPDSPVIQMLEQCLFRQAESEDELVYLDMVGETGETLYFTTSSLKSLEVSPLQGEQVH